MKKFVLSTILFGALLSSFPLVGAIQQPYASVRNLPAIPFNLPESYIYAFLIESIAANIVVDVDSEDGSVARFVAQQHAGLPTVTKVFSISAWKADDSQSNAYQQFLSNVKAENTTNYIIPIRMDVLEAAEGLNIMADFINLSETGSVDEIKNAIIAWYPHLTNKGIIAGNNWNKPHVQAGVTAAADALNLDLNLHDNVWYFKKSFI